MKKKQKNLLHYLFMWTVNGMIPHNNLFSLEYDTKQCFVEKKKAFSR